MNPTPGRFRALARDAIGAGLIIIVGAVVGFVANPLALHGTERVLGPNRVVSDRFVAATIGLDEAKRLHDSGEIIFVDGRLLEAFEKGHIPGALPLFDRAKNAQWAALRRLIPLGARVALVAENDTDFMGRNHASTLRSFGIDGTRILDGGMAAWRAKSFAIATGIDVDPELGGEPK